MVEPICLISLSSTDSIMKQCLWRVPSFLCDYDEFVKWQLDYACSLAGCSTHLIFPLQ